MKIALSIFCFIYFINCFAQDSTSQQSLKPNTICCQKGLKFTINGKKVNRLDLVPYLKTNEKAFAEYQVYRKYSNISTPFALVMIGSFVTTLTQIGKNNKLMIGFGIGTVVSGFIGTKIHNKGVPHLRRAIDIYNSGL